MGLKQSEITRKVFVFPVHQFNFADSLTVFEPHVHGNVPGLDDLRKRSWDLNVVRRGPLEAPSRGLVVVAEAGGHGRGLGHEGDEVVGGPEGHGVSVRGIPPSE